MMTHLRRGHHHVYRGERLGHELSGNCNLHLASPNSVQNGARGALLHPSTGGRERAIEFDVARRAALQTVMPCHCDSVICHDAMTHRPGDHKTEGEQDARRGRSVWLHAYRIAPLPPSHCHVCESDYRPVYSWGADDGCERTSRKCH